MLFTYVFWRREEKAMVSIIFYKYTSVKRAEGGNSVKEFKDIGWMAVKLKV